MKEFQKKILSTIIIMLLLPYILTLFMNGQGVSTININNNQSTITVLSNNMEIQITEEEYLIGILAHEIPLEYSLEAMKAQVVMIRTRLYKESQNQSDYVYEEVFLSRQEILQKWQHSSPNTIYDDLKQAVEETYNKVIKVDENLVITPFHLQNTGATRDGALALGSTDYPHLKSVECNLDVTGVNAASKVRITFDKMKEKLEVEEELTFDSIEILQTAEDGYISEIAINGIVLTGEQFRQMFSLSSSVLSIQEVDQSQIQITSRGYGHGLGLSQNTAHYMALEGKTYKEILKYFYSDIDIKNI